MMVRDGMAPFVLVHGSSGGSWVWQKLAPLLRAAGHDVYAPTLTGLAERAHLLDCGVDLTTHINDVVNVLTFEDLRDVVLVGNSYAGMVITGVAAKVAGRLKLLVYLDAYIPEDGQSAVDLWPPERRAFAAEAEEGGVSEPPPPGLFGVTDPALVDWMNVRMTPHPVSTYTKAVPAGNARSRAVPRAFIHCTGSPPMIRDVFGAFADKARASGWEVYEIEAGHVAMLTAPGDVADVLMKIAGRE